MALNNRMISKARRGRYQGLAGDTNAATGFRRKTFKVLHARYLGGLPDDTKPTRRNNAKLFISDEGIGVGYLKQVQGNVGWNQMFSISFDDSSDRVEMAIQLNEGTVALYEVLGTSAAALRERLLGVMTEKGVRVLDKHR
jgi:hypothetical protein